jgi:hypothetical protein
MDDADTRYVVVGRHEENGLIYELVVIEDEVAAALRTGTLESLWVHNPKVRIRRAAEPGAGTTVAET